MKRYTCTACCLSFLFLLTGCQSVQKRRADDVMLGLEWYSSMDTVKKEMSGYEFDEQYETVGVDGELQTILDYDDIPLYGHTCEDVTLCFTNLGLIGINYYDDDGTYTEWRIWLTEKFGEPTEEDKTSAYWHSSELVGMDTIYVLDMQEEIRISFFADDTGSE